LNWGWFYGDLDLYVWLPSGSSPGGVVGAGGSGSGVDGANDLGPGQLADFPRARWNRDGGYGDYLGMESISIMPKPTMPTAPYYYTTGTMPSQGYDFLVTDDTLYNSRGHLNYPYIVFRYWQGGVIQKQFLKTATCDTAAGEYWWEPGYVGWGHGNTFTIMDQCGTSDIYDGIGPGIFPYTLTHGLSRVSHK